MGITNTPSAARATVRIKQLCCLGLPSEAIIPSVLKELHAVVPSFGNSFFWSDEHYQIRNIYDEAPASTEIIELYMQEFYNRPERELHRGFTWSMQHHHGVIEMDRLLTVDLKSYRKSDFYNLINRTMGYGRTVHLVVHAGGRALGTLIVWRGWDDADFTARDKRCLAHLESFIAHAVDASNSQQGEPQAPLVEDEDRGMVIVDRTGQIQYISDQGRRLLFLATHRQVTAKATQGARLPPEVMRLCRNLVAVFEGTPSAVAPPAYHHRNCWGGFVFRACWLDNDNRQASLIGITIEHQAPLPVKLIRQMERFPLSPRQVRLCLYMASGLSYKQIAQRMDVKESTAIYHSRELYTKLDVHNRTELMAKLVGM